MDYIEINGYKSIRKARIDLAPINILIGANGSGKSNFISFFDFLNRLYKRKLNEYIALKGGDNKILHKGKKTTDTISFKMEFDKGQSGYSATLQSGTAGLVFLEENLIDKGNARNISRRSTEANIKTTDNLRAEVVTQYLTGFRKYHFHDTSVNSPFSRYSNVENDIYYFYEDGMNLAAFMYRIQDQTKKHITGLLKIFSPLRLIFLISTLRLTKKTTLGYNGQINLVM